MKNYLIKFIIAILLFLSCQVAFAQFSADFLNQRQIDNLSNQAYRYLRGRISKDEIVVILNKNNNYQRHTNSIIREIQRNAVNDNYFRVVSRDSNIQALIEAERDFQDNGFVSQKNRVSVEGVLGATHLFAVEIIRERERTFLYVWGISQLTGELRGYERFEPKGEMLNAFDLNGFAGITMPFMIGGSEPSSLGGMGTTLGFSAGASLTFFAEALGFPRVFIPAEIGVMLTQRGFKSESSDDEQVVNYTDLFLRVYPLNRAMGNISGFNPIIGIAYSMNSSKTFDDDVTILTALSYRSRSNSVRFGVDIGADIGTTQVFYDYKAITPRLMINISIM